MNKAWNGEVPIISETKGDPSVVSICCKNQLRSKWTERDYRDITQTVHVSQYSACVVFTAQERLS